MTGTLDRASVRKSKRRILVIDDEPNILEATKVVLTAHNYRVLCAADGPEALALFARQMDSISAVLADMVLPYMDGVSLIRAIKRMKGDVPAIASSGQAEHPHAAELQTLGVTALLTKPYDTYKLLKAVWDALPTAGK